MLWRFDVGSEGEEIGFLAHFGRLEDPRQAVKTVYPLGRGSAGEPVCGDLRGGFLGRGVDIRQDETGVSTPLSAVQGRRAVA